MTLAKKGSKPITVEGTDYRWAVSPDSGYAVLVVQSASGRGAKLIIYVDWSRYKYSFSHTTGIIEIKPSLVGRLIGQARRKGWQPSAQTKDHEFNLFADETLIPKSGAGT